MQVAALRSPSIYRALRSYCLGAFFDLIRELDGGADFPVELAEHSGGARPTLYEYRPLVAEFIAARADRLGEGEEAQEALNALKDEPAAGIFARAHAGERVGEDEALRRTILVPLLVRTAENCGALDWDDEAYGQAYAELEGSLFGTARNYSALAPLVGLTAGGTVELGRGFLVRRVEAGDFSLADPEIARALPHDFGREVDRTLVLECRHLLEGDACLVPDSATEFARAICALRLVIPGAIAAGPVIFEQLDSRPYGTPPLPPMAATMPPGESNRLDSFRAEVVAKIQGQLAEAADDPDLLEAVDRWELALFHTGPQRADELREALDLVLGGDEGPWAAAMRASVLLGDSAKERSHLLHALRGLVEGDGPGQQAEVAIRRALVEVLLHDARTELVRELDKALLGYGPPSRLSTGARALAAS